MNDAALNDEVRQLINYLRSTGTGENKLTAISALACECQNITEFMSRLDSVAGAATVDKAKKFFEQLPKVKEALKAPIKQQQTTTTKTTVETNVVTHPLKEPAKGDKAATEDDEPSEVADLNVNDAKEAIARMRSVDKLTHISTSDTRASIQKAATDRLDELKPATTT